MVLFIFELFEDMKVTPTMGNCQPKPSIIFFIGKILLKSFILSPLLQIISSLKGRNICMAKECAPKTAFTCNRNVDAHLKSS